MKNPKEQLLRDFLVLDVEREPQDFAGEVRIVSATSAQDAIHSYVRKVVLFSEAFQEEVSGRIIGETYCYRFWVQGENEESAFEAGNILIDDAEFVRRVRAFFPKRRWADAYLNHYFSDAEKANFSEDMLFFMWEKIDWIRLAAVELSKIERI